MAEQAGVSNEVGCMGVSCSARIKRHSGQGQQQCRQQAGSRQQLVCVHQQGLT